MDSNISTAVLEQHTGSMTQRLPSLVTVPVFHCNSITTSQKLFTIVHARAGLAHSEIMCNPLQRFPRQAQLLQLVDRAPWQTWRRMLNTSLCAFSTSSKRTTEYGRRLHVRTDVNRIQLKMCMA